MGLKQIFLPTISRIFIFLVLILVTSVFNLATYCPGCTRASYGFPFALYELPGWDLYGPMPGYRILYSGLMVDIVIWYIVSCAVVSIVSQRRKKPDKR
ncbi:MAG TPA: hypothetical protein VJI12_02480 [archaeon]|nr:hypothetical protein [archaeon]